MKNKKNMPIILFFGFVIFVVLYKVLFSNQSSSKDILWANRDYRSAPHFSIDDTKPLVIGESTEADVYDIYGNNADRRLTFKQTRQKTINDQTFNYNKVISFETYTYEYNSGTQGNDVPLEKIEVPVFLLDGKVTYYAVLDATRPDSKSEYIPTNKSVNLASDGSAWPGKEDDIYDYDKENGIKNSRDY